MAKILAIDLGTINSCVAVSIDGKPVVVNAEGQRTTPSVVTYGTNGELIGQSAKQQEAIDPKNTFSALHYFLGKQYNEIGSKPSQVLYDVVGDRNGKVKIQCPVRDRQFAPETILAQILRKLADDTGLYLKEQLTETIITVPISFNDAQRQAVRDAAKIAGLEVIRILPETYAASLAFGFDYATILLLDFGNSLKISSIEVEDTITQVQSTAENTSLSSKNFDRQIVNWLVEEFKRDENIDLSQDCQALQRLIAAAETAKIELSDKERARVYLPSIIITENGSKHIDKILTRSHFEHLCSDILNLYRLNIKQFLDRIGWDNLDVWEVILGGGSAYIPAIQSLVKDIIGKSPRHDTNPDEIFAIGAAALFPNGIAKNFPITLLSDD